jgi:hypothetical protein
MTLWRLAAAGTHLYPGACLRVLEGDPRARLRAGDPAMLEFSDGGAAPARIELARPGHAVLAVAPHATARDAAIAAKRWRIVPAGTPGALRVAARAA